MREWVWVGLVCLVFGLGSARGTGELGVFAATNLGVGTIALTAAALGRLRSFRAAGEGRPRGVLGDAVLQAVAVAWGAVLLQQAAVLTGWRLDWTFERRFELSPAMLQVLDGLPGPITATLYSDDLDPRRRRTRLLLDQIAAAGDVRVRERSLGEAPGEEDSFGIASSNTVVLELGPRWERADRPTEGGLYEALSYLAVSEQRVVYVTTGAGEGDFADTGDTGYSGLAAALETEGISVRQLAASIVGEIPPDAETLLVVAPERPLPEETLAAFDRFLRRGGSLVALLEPGTSSGLETLLARWGMQSEDAWVVDPASGSIRGEDPATNPIAYHYGSDNLVTRGLDANRRTYFRGARSFRLRKPEPEDRIRAVVFSSGDAWLADEARARAAGGDGRPPAEVRTDYLPLVVTGQYPRGGVTPRIVAFGDADFASNAHLRTLYNLDLALNAVHWALRDEPRIRLRPKAGGLIQFPVPIQNSLQAFYGVGLAVPQLLLLAGGLVTLRRYGS